MSKVAINAEILRWARERSGHSLEDLAPAFPRLGDWEAGDATPTLRQLEKFARRTWTPLGYFFLGEPPEDRLPIPDFRTVAGPSPARPSPNLLETVYDMLGRQDWMREYRVDQGQDALPFIGAASDADSVAATASHIRDVLGLEQGWASRLPTWHAAFAALRSAAESTGVLVMVNGIVRNNTNRVLDPDEFRGFVLTDPYAPLVFVNGADAKAAQLFTLAHELAHVWFNVSAAFDLRGLQPSGDATERRCNAVAAELLLPETELQVAWGELQTAEDPYEAVARHFKVSQIVGARRLLDLGFIDRAAFFSFYDSYVDDERRKRGGQGGGNFYVTLDYKLGRPFANAVISAAREGRLLYKDAYDLLGAKGETFEKFAERLGWSSR